MKTKSNISRHIKRLIAFIVICLAAITLVSCDSANRISKGSLNLDEVYATAGDLKVTKGELYNSMRYNSATYLTTRIDKALYAEEIKTIKDNIETYKDQLDSKVLTAIYGSDEDETIAEMGATAKSVAVKTYIADMYEKGHVITEAQIEAKEFASVYEEYYLEVAKRLAAINKLKETIGMNEDGTFPTPTADTHYTKTKVIDYYDDNIKNSGDVTAILIRFVSSNEAAKLLKKFGIVAYNNKFYLVKTPDTLENYATDSAWEDYVSSTNKEETSIEESGNGMATITKLFAAMYNFIYGTTREELVLDSTIKLADYADKNNLQYYFYAKAIVEADGNYRANLVVTEEENTEYADNLAKVVAYNEANGYATTVLTKERMDKYSTSLTTYLTTKLSTAGGASDTQYTSKATDSYDGYYYLTIKLDQAAVDELYTKVVDDETSTTTYEFEGHEAMVQEVCQKMFDEEITDDYIDDIYEERAKDVKVVIYDSIVELEYMQSDSTHADNYEKSKKTNANNIADITYNGNTTSVTADELYNDLEPIYGPSFATASLFEKWLKTTEYYSKYNTTEYYDQFVNQIKNLTTYFSYGYYSSYGYDTDLGVYNFLRLVYQDNDIDNIIYNSLMVSNASNDFFQEAYKDASFISKIAGYAKKNFNDYYSLTATKINVFFDKDEDGVADAFDEANRGNASDLINELIDYVRTAAVCYDGAIEEVIAEYNSATRFESADPSTAESMWTKYKKLGLAISTEDVTVSNSSVDANTAIDTKLKALYQDATVINQEQGFITNILDTDVAQDEDSLYFLLLTNATTRTSAKSEDENIEKLYTRIPVINDGKVEYVEVSNYDSVIPTDEQIKVYILDYLKFSDVSSLPAETIAALDAYLLPVLERYSSTASQYQIILNTIGTVSFNENNAERSEHLSTYIENQKAELDGFKPATVYADWWNTMYSK